MSSEGSARDHELPGDPQGRQEGGVPPFSRATATTGPLSRLVDTQKRQARDFLSDVVRMRGLMPLLMKHRNGGSWTAAEKAELLMQLRILSRISPYLLFLLLPGSALLLPVYAWWLDRRHKPRRGTPSAASCPESSSGVATNRSHSG